MNKKDLKNVYPILQKEWKKHSNKCYQKINQRLMNAVNGINNINNPSINLLDIGCNAGVLSAVAASRFKSVVGIDPSKESIKKAKVTAQVLKVSNCKFKTMPLLDYVTGGQFDKDGIDAILGCQVLYHLTTEEIDAITGKLPQINTVIVTARPDKGKSNNNLGLFTIESITKWLSSYEISIANKNSKWPVIIATKANI